MNSLHLAKVKDNSGRLRRVNEQLKGVVANLLKECEMQIFSGSSSLSLLPLSLTPNLKTGPRRGEQIHISSLLLILAHSYAHHLNLWSIFGHIWRGQWLFCVILSGWDVNQTSPQSTLMPHAICPRILGFLVDIQFEPGKLLKFSQC